MVILDKRYFRPLHIFSVEYKSPMGLPDQEHVFTGIQKFTQEQLDKFFKVDELAKKPSDTKEAKDN